jgi:serine/threonine protein kinase
MDPQGRSDAFQAGQSFGRFYLVQLIGEGGTSRIFKALQQPINRIVALKIPSFADAGQILTPDEFLSEATLMARLEHANVTRIYDFGVHEDKAFICMEYVDGWNLLELVEARGALPDSAVLAAGIQILEALSYAHSHDVLHLDLSPANVLVNRQGTAKLSDFGMAGKKTRSAEGRIVGTPAFLSPEHVAGIPGTRRSDLFSFGSLLYYAAAGEPLFDPGPGNTRVTQAIREIGDGRARLPEDRLRKLPAGLSGPVRLALRGEDAGALAAGLRAAFRAAAGEARPEDVLRRELDLGNDPLEPYAGAEPGEGLRERYLGLREAGRHREAVALLERALRREPDHPMLKELLALPPARARSAAATVDVGSPALPARPPAAPARPARVPLAISAALGIMAVTVALVARARLSAPAEAPAAVPVPAGSRAALPDPGTAARAEAVPPPRPAPTVLPEPPPRPAATRHPGNAAPAARRAPRPLPPAVALAGPAGTRVSVDDTAEWVAPGPKGGWPVAPGLVNITLTPPGSGRPISSSLFVSADTLYVLSLDSDGGFSVDRRRR